MTDKVKIKFRSDIGMKRYQVDQFEEVIQKAIKMLNELNYYYPEIVKGYEGYLKWCISTLESIKDKKMRMLLDEDAIEEKIKLYEKRINSIFKDMHNISSAKFIKQPIIGYSTFLENGIKVYAKYIDTYNLWFTPSDAYSLLKNKEATLTTYSFIAMLSRFTLNKHNPMYTKIFFNNFKNAKLSLPQAYLKPNYQNIVGILFLCFIAMSYYNTTSCIHYFDSAVKMAQILGYDKKEKEQLFFNEEDKQLWYKDKKVWKSISMIYFTLVTYIPNLPTFNTKFEPIILNQSFVNQSNQIDGKPYYESSFKPNDTIQRNTNRFLYDERKVIECLSYILSHIQKVKNEHHSSVDLITNQHLRLPTDKFNEVHSILKSQTYNDIADLDITQGVTTSPTFLKVNPESKLFNYQLNIFCKVNLIFLYYPYTLVFPKPILFPFNEAIMLFDLAQSISQFYFNMYDYKKMNNISAEVNLACAKKTLAGANLLTIHSPYYSQSMFVIYVYFNFISQADLFIQQGFDTVYIQESKIRTLKLLNLLNCAKGSDFKAEVKDAKNTINNIILNLNHFNLPEDFVRHVKLALNIN